MEKFVKTKKRKVETFDCGNGFFVEIVTIAGKGSLGNKYPHYEAWLYYEHCGIKEFMFGTSSSNYQEFIDVVLANYDDYEDFYIEDYLGGHEDED